jgi:hypothetical protein
MSGVRVSFVVVVVVVVVVGGGGGGVVVSVETPLSCVLRFLMRFFFLTHNKHTIYTRHTYSLTRSPIETRSRTIART